MTEETRGSNFLVIPLRFLRKTAMACSMLVLVLAFALRFSFLEAVAVQELLQTSSAFVAPGHADIHTQLVANISGKAEPAVDIGIVSQVGTNGDKDGFNISWGELWNYQILDKLGEGEYSKVYKGVNLLNNESCVIKVLKPVKMRRVKREIKILQDLAGGPNIIGLLDVVQDVQNMTPSIVFEYVNNTHHKRLYPTFNDFDVRYYIFGLLEALSFAHDKGIMHRDVKPYNVMINHPERKLSLIDWGLADYYREGKEYTTSVASRYWRSPEVLIDYEEYNPSMDIWSVGCMLAAMVFRKEPFFHGQSDTNQLVKILRVLGSDTFFDWLDRYDVELEEEVDNVVSWYPKQAWSKFVNSNNRHLVNDDAFDLLDRMLRYDHNDRITAKEAMAHPYFDSVRQAAG